MYLFVFSIASLLTKYCKECTKLQISFFIVAIASKVFKMVSRKALKDSISFMLCFIGGTMEDGRSTSVFLLYWQISKDRMADFPTFIASKSFDL